MIITPSVSLVTVILELPESNGLSALQTTCPPESVPFTPEAVMARYQTKTQN